MTLKPEDNIENGEQTQEQNPVLQAQEPFKDRAFCIIGDEMKAKMEALGLDENDIAEISYENENSEYLELIDLYFPQVQEVRNILEKEYQEEYSGSKEYMSGDEFQKMINNETKRSLLAMLSYHNSLFILFSRYPDKINDVFKNKGDNLYNFLHLLAYSKNPNKYQFDFNLAVKFFELAEKIERNRKGGEDRYDVFDGICDAYDNLYEKIQKPELFNDLLKLCISAGESECINLLKILKNFNVQSDVEVLGKNYDVLIKLGIIAGKNSSTIFQYTSYTLKFLNWKQKDLIISGFEKLGPDFIHILNHSSGFIENISEKFPDRFVEFCGNLKKLANYSQDNAVFYNKCLTGVTEFIVNYPDKWDYLLKIGEIFRENTSSILSIGKSFVFEFIKHFPNNYEEILLEVRKEGFLALNDGLFFSYGLKFLAKFLEKGKEKFFTCLKKLVLLHKNRLEYKNNSPTFFIDGLEFITYYMFWFPENFPEVGERIIELINKYSKNKNINEENFFRQFMGGFNNYIDAKIIDQDPKILDELLNFLEKVGGSKDALRVIKSLGEITFDLPDDDEIHDYKALDNKNKLSKKSISFTLAYLLKHKKSKIIPFIKNLNLIKDLNLGVNINQVLLGGVSLEYKSNEELQELFAGENVEDTKAWKYFIKIGGQNHQKLVEMKVWINSIIPKKGKIFDKSKIIPTIVKIQNIFAEKILEYFEKVIHKKIHLKFKREFKLSKDFDDSLLNKNLFEVYKMYSSTRINKQQAFELIQRYLNGEVYTGSGDILQTYPYNREENRLFLDETLQDKSHIWLSRNEKTFELQDTSENTQENTDNIPERIAHHLKVSNEKLKLLEIKDEKGNQIIFENHSDLRKYFNLTLKKEREKYDINLFHDLEFQIQEIERLLKSNNEQRKKVSKIKIYHELNPLKIAMMGNWVDGSCLSYYHSVGNYWSAITNAVEVNKGVFYIEDEYGNVIARVLVGVEDFGNNEKYPLLLAINPIYLKGNIGINLQKYFDKYMKNLSRRLGIKIDDECNRHAVTLLFCDRRYDGD